MKGGEEPPGPNIKFKYFTPNQFYVVGVGENAQLTILSSYVGYSKLVWQDGEISEQTRDWSADRDVILERLAAQGFSYETSQIVFDMMGYSSGQTIEGFAQFVEL